MCGDVEDKIGFIEEVPDEEPARTVFLIHRVVRVNAEGLKWLSRQ